MVSAPCVIFEDEHLLAVNKPAGMNTHAPASFAGEGIYDWLKHREPRWSRLAIIHRLDKETSGVLVFSKTGIANRSLTRQFRDQAARKTYLLLTDRAVPWKTFTAKSALARLGGKYVERPGHAGGEMAETRFHPLESSAGRTLMEARPFTGRTHQIRVHAAANGFPVLGDALYGGTPAARLHLHSRDLTLHHPETGREIMLSAPVDFARDIRFELRAALIDERETNAFRLVHGAGDGRPGWYVDRLGEFLLSQTAEPLTVEQRETLAAIVKAHRLSGAFHKALIRPAGRTSIARVSQQRMPGADAPEEFIIRENGLRFAMKFTEGCSVGLFLDQRDNRRRFLVNHAAADFPLFDNGPEGGEVLNTFAYTCGFSVCAARAGARTTSIDLSKKYLEWGRRNFTLNRMESNRHEFLPGDVFDWLRRLAKKRRRFDAVVLDPPTFSRSKEHGAFQAAKDFGRLVTSALPILKPNGVLFASTNAEKLSPERFLSGIADAARSARRRIIQLHYAPQSPDFPIHRDEPAYLKTLWLRLA